MKAAGAGLVGLPFYAGFLPARFGAGEARTPLFGWPG